MPSFADSNSRALESTSKENHVGKEINKYNPDVHRINTKLTEKKRREEKKMKRMNQRDRLKVNK